MNQWKFQSPLVLLTPVLSADVIVQWWLMQHSCCSSDRIYSLIIVNQLWMIQFTKKCKCQAMIWIAFSIWSHQYSYPFVFQWLTCQVQPCNGPWDILAFLACVVYVFISLLWLRLYDSESMGFASRYKYLESTQYTNRKYVPK